MSPRSWRPISTPIDSGISAAKSPRTPQRACVAWSSHTSAARSRDHRYRRWLRSGNPKVPCTTPSCRAAPDWSPARGWAASCVRHRRATSTRLAAAAGNRMPKMRERRRRQIVVGQRREYLIDRVGPSCEIGPDHVDRTFRSDEVGRPRQVEPPLQIGAASRPQAKVSVLADDLQCHVLFGDVRKGDPSLPAAPAGRLCVLRADDISDLRVQAIRTDQQIPFGRAAVFEVDPHSVVSTDHPDRTGVASDAIGRKALQQTVKQDRRGTCRTGPPTCPPSWSRRWWRAGDPSMSRSARWTAIDRPLHVDAQLLQNRRAIGPDSHRTATGPHIRPLLEDGDVMSVPQ